MCDLNLKQRDQVLRSSRRTIRQWQFWLARCAAAATMVLACGALAGPSLGMAEAPAPDAPVAPFLALPAATAAPSTGLIFRADFEQGLAGFDESALIQGAVLEVIEDPTGGGRGRVLKGTIKGRAALEGRYLAHRAAVGVIPPALAPFPCRIQQDLWMSRRLWSEIRGSNWYSPLGFLTLAEGESYEVAATAIMIEESPWTGFGLGINKHLTLDIHDEGGRQHFLRILPGGSVFTPEVWHTVAMEVDRAGMVSLSQDGRLLSSGHLMSKHQKHLAMAYGGPIYGGPSFSDGAFVLVDNFVLACR